MMQLRDYQRQAVDATIHHFRHSNDPAVIVLPTGAGKSLVIAELARLAKQRILVVTHVKELVEQNFQKFIALAPELNDKAGCYAAGLNLRDSHHQVTFASIQSVARNLSAFAQYASLVIIDECHRVSDDAENSQYSQLFAHLQNHNANLKILGLTATPYRLASGWIYQYHYYGFRRTDQVKRFKRCIYELPLRHLIKQGYLTSPTLLDPTIAHYDFSALGSENPTEQQMNTLLRQYPTVTEGIVADIIRHAKERQGVMIFAATVRHAKDIVNYLTHHLNDEQPIGLVTAKTSMPDRNKVIQQFKDKQFKFLVNVSVLTTGFDAPHVDFIAILRPTESVSLFQQIVGRGLRLSKDKHDCLVIDYAGNRIDIFAPEVGSSRPHPDSKPVQVHCPSCGFANTFWGRLDGQGQIIEHYGRKCMGYFEDDDTNEVMHCDYRFRFKLCPNCNRENDIAARQCHHCHVQLVDPDDKLKAALNLKDHIVIRCAGMTFEHQQQRLTVTYHDEDGFTLKEHFDFSKPNQVSRFETVFAKRNRGQATFRSVDVEQICAVSDQFNHPDFVIARQTKRYVEIIDRLFDYHGRYRTAD